MIYFVTGEERGTEEREKVLKTAQGLVSALQKKRPNALVFRMSGDEWNRDSFDGIATGQGLFENKYIVVLDSLFQNEEAAEYLKDKLEGLSVAEHAFVVIECAPKTAVKNLIKKFAEKVWEIKEAPVTNKKDFNIFALTDAFGERNKSRLWTLYQKALMSGNEPEAIHGVLFWQVKSLLAAAQSKNAEDAGLKPFVWGKARGFLKNYSLDELKKISSDMVNLYHLSRIESVPFEIALEEFVLGVEGRNATSSLC
ncbi:MAG: hypothetical protein AAB635_00615 [Patescibacteria group bacterium]